MHSHPLGPFPQYLVGQCLCKTFPAIWGKICMLTWGFRGHLLLQKCQNVELKNLCGANVM